MHSNGIERERNKQQRFRFINMHLKNVEYSMKNIRPFAISGTRTIEPGRAFIKLPAAKGAADTDAATAASWFTEQTVGDACDTVVSAMDCAHELVAVLVVCVVELTDNDAPISLSSWTGTTGK